MADPQNPKTTVRDWALTVLFAIAAGTVVILFAKWAGATTGLAVQTGVIAGVAAILSPIIHTMRTKKT